MKPVVASVVLAAIVVIACLGIYRKQKAPGPEAEIVAPTVDRVQAARPRPAVEVVTAKAVEQLPMKTNVRPQPVATAEAPWTVEQAVEILVSPRSTYLEKQSAWNRLKNPEQLDKAILDLEERAKAYPQVADYPAVLGRAYLHKAGLTQDLREQAILGMTADKTFDAALEIDPQNWEARYMKALGMSYWPTQMNKGGEVLERFTSLIQDQEQQSARPEFSQPYVRLGDEYRKAGQIDNAQQVWQRGATLFPNDTELKRKLASIQ